MRKPWNAIDLTVYSLATMHNNALNMNICTYVSAVSMQPKQYMIAIYHGSQTLAVAQQTETAVLQILSTAQTRLVKTLGHKSGTSYNKHQYLNNTKQLSTWQSWPVLTDAFAYLLLRKLQVMLAGDHDIFLYEVVAQKTANAGSTILTTNYLRDKKLLR
jgi:flavin reductase (DIM6/NTAB) family NADH-FMN oxidoreductase RutF